MGELQPVELTNHHFVYLPLMAPKGKSVDDMVIDECKDYAEGLMKRFAELLAAVGPGEHQFEFRIAPRSAVNTGEDFNIDGPSPADGSDAYSCLSQSDEDFTHFVQSELESQASAGGIAAADTAGLRAVFQLDIDESLCSGGGPERFAQPFATFADNVAEHCEAVMEIAHKGIMGSAAREYFGQDPGKAVHVVLPERPDHVGNIGDFGVAADQKDGGRRFIAWAFFLNPDDPDSDDAEGCMVKCWVSKYTKRKHQQVPNPEWITEKIGMYPAVKLGISNKNIRAAMDRDGDNPIGWAA